MFLWGLSLKLPAVRGKRHRPRPTRGQVEDHRPAAQIGQPHATAIQTGEVERGRGYSLLDPGELRGSGNVPVTRAQQWQSSQSGLPQ